MTATSSWPRATLRRPGYPNPGIRVSDAERADIADRLARHYGEGRLDMTEFDERVTRAMAAKTIADFLGLFDDLPDLPGPPADPLAGTAKTPGTPRQAAGNWDPYEDTRYRTRRQRRRARRRGPVRLVLMAVLAIVAATIAWHAVTFWITPLIWLALLAAITLIVVRVRHR
jgi:hypothetical protein